MNCCKLSMRGLESSRLCVDEEPTEFSIWRSTVNMSTEFRRLAPLYTTSRRRVHRSHRPTSFRLRTPHNYRQQSCRPGTLFGRCPRRSNIRTVIGCNTTMRGTPSTQRRVNSQQEVTSRDHSSELKPTFQCRHRRCHLRLFRNREIELVYGLSRDIELTYLARTCAVCGERWDRGLFFRIRHESSRE